VAKLAPRELAQVLSKLPTQDFPNVIVGFEKSDDAGVFRLNDTTALVHTVDFFTPVADDPEIYGRVAAINALNDIYAMGGTPLSALSIVCYPQKGDWDVLGQILEGGQREMNSANVPVIGGHSIDDPEMKFGYSVTGVIDPSRVVRNAGAVHGDLLVLTKALGTGAINTAVKRGFASRESETAAIEAMTTSAARASNEMLRLGANACTDVTGFGLIGHAYEMASASEVTLEIESARVPLLPDVLQLIGQGMLTRGDRNNRDYVEGEYRFSPDVTAAMQSALFDPQTAGGLLISLPEAGATEFVKMVEGAAIIGIVRPRGSKLIEIK